MEELNSHNWYAVAAILLGAVIFAARKATPAMWQKVPDGWRWAPAAVVSFATGFVTAYQEGKDVTAAIVAGMGAVFFVGLPASGAHGWAKEVKAGLEKRRHQKEGGDDV